MTMIAVDKGFNFLPILGYGDGDEDPTASHVEWSGWPLARYAGMVACSCSLWMPSNIATHDGSGGLSMLVVPECCLMYTFSQT